MQYDGWVIYVKSNRSLWIIKNDVLICIKGNDYWRKGATITLDVEDHINNKHRDYQILKIKKPDIIIKALKEGGNITAAVKEFRKYNE